MPTHAWPYSNISSLTDWYGYANDLTDGTMGVFLLFAVFMLSMRVSDKSTQRKQLLSSSFITFVFAVFFRSLGFLTDLWVVICFGGVLAVVGYYAYTRD